TRAFALRRSLCSVASRRRPRRRQVAAVSTRGAHVPRRSALRSSRRRNRWALTMRLRATFRSSLPKHPSWFPPLAPTEGRWPGYPGWARPPTCRGQHRRGARIDGGSGEFTNEHLTWCVNGITIHPDHTARDHTAKKGGGAHFGFA